MMEVYFRRMLGIPAFFMALLFLLYWGMTANAQTPVQVTGKITLNDGSPAPGVSVTVKGSSNGVISDAQGIYRITVPGNAVLVFSQIGSARQEIVVNNRREINVTLQDDVSQLNEVVVVGYGTQKKVNLSGAVAQISGEDLANKPVPNVTAAL